MRRLVQTLACLAAILLPATAFAQASITGVVRDTSGAVLPGVTVEAASPVLIEKVRTATTDGNGRYQMVDLRPGAYTVTFTVSGFNAVRRDGITLSGSATATVDVELRVGAREETITVTAEAPVVDVQTTTRQAVLTADTIDALPAARNYLTLARLIPGTVGGGTDVGGSNIQGTGGSVIIHGSRDVDQRVTLNGISMLALPAGGQAGGESPDVGLAAEVTIDHTAVSAELPTGGVRINFIPRDGGNTWANSTFFTFSNSDLQGDNFSDELRARGFATPNRVVSNHDLSESFGGPLKRDRVWFWLSVRHNRVENEAGVFKNKNAFDPTKWLYEPDTSRPGVNAGLQVSGGLRLTWQATPRNKIAGMYKADAWCQCPYFIGGPQPPTPPSSPNPIRAPEAAQERYFPRLRTEYAEWTSPVTNRLLIEATGVHIFERWGSNHLEHADTLRLLDVGGNAAVIPQLISVLEQSTNMIYRASPTFNNSLVPNFAYRAAASYVTGTHSLKAGFNRTHGFQTNSTYAFQPYQYRFNNGVPNLITMFATPYATRNNEDNDLGIYAQDRWRLDRFTINLALRYDTFNSSFAEQRIGPGPLVPTRNVVFPAQDDLAWKDFTYRTGLTYDLRGNGKTALKVTFNKYLLGQGLNALASTPNPVNRLVNSTTRSWNDANRNYIPECDLLNTALNLECGPMANANFGTAVPGDTYDQDLLTGRGHRPRNWEFSTGIQHELLPRVSLDVGYFRRIWGNFQVADNLALAAEDFDNFSITVPQDSRLPNGGGYRLDGLRDLKPSAFGRPAQNYNTLSDKYGKQIEHWNGLDVGLNARLQNGLVFQAGTSSGKTTLDNCAVVAKLPEVNFAGNQVPQQFCHSETKLQTQFKALGIYTIPRVDVQVSSTFRSTPGDAINSNFVVSNAYIAANGTLGRPLSGGLTNMTVSLLQPSSKFLDRRNELDLRFGKVVRVGRTRSVVSLDVFNALNSDAVLGVNQSFASWLVPTQMLYARLAKISVQFEF